MIPDLKPYASLIKLAAIAAAVVALWVAVDRHNTRQQKIGYDQAVGEYKDQKTKDDLATLVKERSMQKKLQDAQNDALERESQLRAIHAAADKSARGLRNTIAGLRGQLATVTAEACRRTAEAALVVFSECTDQYREVAEAADRFGSSATTLNDAWPEGDES